MKEGNIKHSGGADNLSDIFLASLIRPRLYPKDLYSSMCSIANYVSSKPRIRASMQRHTWALLSFPLDSVLTGPSPASMFLFTGLYAELVEFT